jgi:SAM-dependent methyltransferase
VAQTVHTDTVYADPKFRAVDAGTMMRAGHPDIAEGDRFIVSKVLRLRDELGRPLRVLDVGSGSGDLTLLLAGQLPDGEVIASEIAPNPLAQAYEKLAPVPRTSIFPRPFEEWTEPVDVVISWGSHHHLDHDYLVRVADVLAPDGALIVGDEFCPEYLSGADQRRLARAGRISIVDGFLFTDEDELAEYRSSGRVPGASVELERSRRRALWHWYKFVGDYAVAHDAWDVLIAELAIARDDLVTSFGGEHKTSPCLLEHELSRRGFEIVDRTSIGDREPELSSFVIYTCRPAAREPGA